MSATSAGSAGTGPAGTLVYLPGVAGHPADSPALDALGAAGWDVVVPVIPGLDGRSGFEVPEDYLGWLVVVWDALDATGALPCPVVGASLGGMLAADLAVLRPEAVTALVLLAPFGIFDEANPGFDLYAVPAAERMGHLFAKGVPEPFVERFAELGPDDGPVARYLSDVAAASLLWPLGDRGHAGRLHRIGRLGRVGRPGRPALVLWASSTSCCRYRCRPAGPSTACPSRSWPAPATSSSGTSPTASPSASRSSSVAARPDPPLARPPRPGTRSSTNRPRPAPPGPDPVQTRQRCMKPCFSTSAT